MKEWEKRKKELNKETNKETSAQQPNMWVNKK